MNTAVPWEKPIRVIPLQFKLGKTIRLPIFNYLNSLGDDSLGNCPETAMWETEIGGFRANLPTSDVPERDFGGRILAFSPPRWKNWDNRVRKRGRSRSLVSSWRDPSDLLEPVLD
jgi:hypothetical protein